MTLGGTGSTQSSAWEVALVLHLAQKANAHF